MPDAALPTREQALALVHEWTASESLRRHMLAVESAMRAYARRLGGDEARWGLAGLVHDFDYERYPNAAFAADQEHPAEGVRHLRALGYPEDVLDAILGHADYTGVPRVTPMARALYAVDELSGLITAAALIRPTRRVADVDVANVRKRMKDKAFSRGIDRAHITRGAAALGVDLDEHVGVVLAALQADAERLGL